MRVILDREDAKTLRTAECYLGSVIILASVDLEKMAGGFSARKIDSSQAIARCVGNRGGVRPVRGCADPRLVFHHFVTLYA